MTDPMNKDVLKAWTAKLGGMKTVSRRGSLRKSPVELSWRPLSSHCASEGADTRTKQRMVVGNWGKKEGETKTEEGGSWLPMGRRRCSLTRRLQTPRDHADSSLIDRRNPNPRPFSCLIRMYGKAPMRGGELKLKMGYRRSKSSSRLSSLRLCSM